PSSPHCPTVSWIAALVRRRLDLGTVPACSVDVQGVFPMLNLPTVLLMLVMVFHGAAPFDRAQDHAGAVMGFDQEKTAHHFSLYNDGGAIAVVVKDPADTQNLDAIRNHLRHIATMFSAGEFDAPMLVHDTKDVPGIDV